MEDKFSKEQILESKCFEDIEKDVLKVLLEDKEYSLEETREQLKSFNESEVK